MKHTWILAIIFAAASPLLHASEQITVNWDQVCKVSQGKELLLTTANGDQVNGYCVGIDVEQVSIQTKTGIVKIARSKLSHIRMHRPNNVSQMRALKNMLHGALHDEAGLLFSPHAVAGIISIPPTVAYGIIAVPFCLLGDLGNRRNPVHEIKIN